MNILAIDTSSDACSAALLVEERLKSQIPSVSPSSKGSDLQQKPKLAGGSPPLKKGEQGVFKALAAPCGSSNRELYLEHTVEPRAHTRLILPMVEAVLAQGGITLQNVDVLAFGRGPGAFTGVRIATGIVQGLALAADKPVVAVSTLAALAQQTYVEQGAEQVLVAVDARMAEVYWGAYTLQDGYMQLQGEEHVLPPEAAPLPEDLAGVKVGKSWHASGSGWAAYADTLQPRFESYISGVSADLLPSAAYIAELAVRGYERGEAVVADEAQPVYLRNKVAQTTQERAKNSK